MVPTESGSLKIDGFDINHVKLQRLRNAVSIVPQQPALFQGTVRTNLDPANSRSDADVLNALSRVQLSHLALEHRVSDSGDNLSIGERQLLCLARTLLRAKRLLVMDEATANVDYQSDAKVQTVVRDQLNQTSVICIAHRLATIIDYDKVMLLERGQLAEFGAPAQLLADSMSSFHGLCAATGELEHLIEEANRAYQKKTNGNSQSSNGQQASC